MGRGAGAAGVVGGGVPSAGVEPGAPWEFGSGLCCPKQGNAANAKNKTTRKHASRMRKSDLLSWGIGGTIPNGRPIIAVAIRKAPLVLLFNVAPFSVFLSPSIFLARILQRNRTVIRQRSPRGQVRTVRGS
jgi:hypothetical protein